MVVKTTTYMAYFADDRLNMVILTNQDSDPWDMSKAIELIETFQITAVVSIYAIDIYQR